MSLHPDLCHALARMPRILVVVDNPNGGEPLYGQVEGAVSETHVRFVATDGLAFTSPAADLRVLTSSCLILDREVVAS